MLRFAFSPVDELRINPLRLALINAIVSQQRHEGFILRIEDADKEHTIQGNDTEVKQFLEKFAIRHDHLLYQSESRHRHQQLAASLLEQGKAFVCTCPTEAGRCSGNCPNRSADDLTRIRDTKTPYVLRIKQPEVPITFTDTIQGEITTPPQDLDSFVILRADGTPSGTFATAVDDMLGGITLVIRCTSSITQTPEQIHIRSQLGYDQPITYAHLPALLDTDGETGTVKWLFKEGFLPDAILNYLLLPGNKIPTEIFTLPEAMEWFDFKNISRIPARFDLEKLRFLNREHLRRMDDKALSGLYRFADANIGKLIKVYLTETSTLKELDERIKPIFAPKPCDGEWGEAMRTLAALIATAPFFKAYDDFTSYLSEHTGLEGSTLTAPLRLLLTGTENDPDLRDIYPHIQSYLTEVARCPH